MSDAATRPLWRALYDEAFDRFGAIALWSCRRMDDPQPGHALAIARALRYAGGMPARRLAERIEGAARAAD